jgi:hypothetical protein
LEVWKQKTTDLQSNLEILNKSVDKVEALGVERVEVEN